MRRLATLALATLALTLGRIVAPAEAALLNNRVGMEAPTRTITFSEVAVAPGTPIGNAFEAFGVLFSDNVVLDDFATTGVPNVAGEHAGNWPSPATPYAPFHIRFTSRVTAAALVLATNFSPTPTTISSYLDGVLIETAAIQAGDPNILDPQLANPNTYFGFTDSLFNELRIAPETAVNQAAMIDNVQFAAAVPEPATLQLFAAGLLALGAARGSRRGLRRLRPGATGPG